MLSKIQEEILSGITIHVEARHQIELVTADGLPLVPSQTPTPSYLQGWQSASAMSNCIISDRGYLKYFGLWEGFVVPPRLSTDAPSAVNTRSQPLGPEMWTFQCLGSQRPTSIMNITARMRHGRQNQ